MKPSRIVIGLVVVAALVGAYFIFTPDDTADLQESIVVPVKEGPLYITAKASGELIAKRSEKITGPTGLRSVRLYNVTIQELVPEGTVVKKGDFIASLDKTDLDSRIKDAQAEVDQVLTQLDQAKIDTAIEMRGLRDDLINLKFSMDEKRLQLELSKYEPQAVYQQAELDLAKAQRDYAQLENKIKLTKEKSLAKIGEINASLRQEELRLNRLLDFEEKMTIYAPKDGMVIHIRDWDGKRGPGSQVSAWDPAVAELPDLSEMMVKAYINEVDISKIMIGQAARITVDAFPGKEYPGMVVTKANIGEQVRNYDTKVFEVQVVLQEQDSMLRPAMTAGIRVLVDSVGKCLQVPLDAIQADSVSFVYLKERGGFVKKEVVTGPSNDMSISIAAGLQVGDMVSLNTPENPDDLRMIYLDGGVKDVALQKLKRDMQERMRKQQELAKRVSADDLPGASEQRSRSRIIVF